MTTTEDEKAFHDALDENREDRTTRLVLADYLEERDDIRGPGYRALALRGLRPNGTYYFGWTRENNAHITGLCDSGPDKGKPVNWNTDPVRRREYLKAALPVDWFNVLNVHGSYAWVESYRSRREAEDAAALAFPKLPPDRRAELLRGPHED